MERLTERFSNGEAGVRGCGSNCKYGFKYCRDHLGKCPSINEIYEKLAEYEDLAEQRKLLKLPCTVGDTLYRINRGAKDPVIQMTITQVGIISLKTKDFVIEITCRDESDHGETHYFASAIGKIIFCSREESEAALKS